MGNCYNLKLGISFFCCLVCSISALSTSSLSTSLFKTCYGSIGRFLAMEKEPQINVLSCKIIVKFIYRQNLKLPINHWLTALWLKSIHKSWVANRKNGTIGEGTDRSIPHPKDTIPSDFFNQLQDCLYKYSIAQLTMFGLGDSCSFPCANKEKQTTNQNGTLL
jgi:hypothetical protein